MINRLDYVKKYCHNSSAIEESVLNEAIMEAVLKTAKQNEEVLPTLKLHMSMSLTETDTDDRSIEIQIRIAEMDAEFKDIRFNIQHSFVH